MIEVGEYGRTNKGQIFIFCYVEQLENETFIMVRRPNKEYVNASCFEKYWLDEDEEIVKHSKNIIDLIEPGDLVRIFVEENVDENGTTEDTCVYEVTATQVKDFYGNKLEEIGIVGEDGTELIPFANVRGIVTREQFASMEYKVKEE